ncbi:hypothetical protein [Streptomyces sp. NPDC095817]|uniref:hypothetical protein n=1 Tax=Streptomyces sp. NPDC095817 TaxID=3155082 RepID=UPI00332D0519
MTTPQKGQSMSEVQLRTTELSAQYGTQVATDLERNAAEQVRVSAELEALQERLHALQHDHSVLVNIQQALSSIPAGAAASTVPQQSSSTTRSTKVKVPVTAQGKKAGPRKASAKAATAKPSQPSLVDLVRGHLEQSDGPLSAAEITTALAKAHPHRNIKPTVVRTTVENLVAKSQAQRSKQGSSVYYTPVASSPSKPAAES